MPSPRSKRWLFDAGARVPRWLVETTNCTAIFNWSAVVAEDEDGWLLAPTEPVRRSSPPFLLRPATEHHRGVAVPTGTITVSYTVDLAWPLPDRAVLGGMKVAARSARTRKRLSRSRAD